MRLFEFADNDPLRVKLVAVVSQLKSRISDTNTKEPMTTDALIELLAQNDIEVDKSDLYDMVKKEPLSNIIQNINGHEVIFKGQTSNDMSDLDPGENEKTREKMAKSALK
jgi:hypothetical protein